jgi:hypothetical protein
MNTPEDSSEHHTRRRENLKSHILSVDFCGFLQVRIADAALVHCNRR